MLSRDCNTSVCGADVVGADREISAPCCILRCGCLCSPLPRLDPVCFSSVHKAPHKQWKKSGDFKMLWRKLSMMRMTLSQKRCIGGQVIENIMHFPPHVFLFSEKEKPPHSKTKQKQEKKNHPKLPISFIERKEMKPNSSLAGNSTVFHKAGCGTDGPCQTHLFS